MISKDILKYFELYELLPRKEYAEWYPVYGEGLWRMWPYEYLWTLHQLRAKYGPLIMNDWYDREDDPEANQFRGWRPMDCPIGATLSRHKFFRAGDLVPTETTAEVMRWDALQHPYETPFKYITEIEEYVPWFHFSVGDHSKALEGIRVI